MASIKLKPVDVVVVGSGVAGSIVCKELAETGLKVVCLERGRWHSPFEERKDDLVNQRNASLGVAYGPDEEKNPRLTAIGWAPDGGAIYASWSSRGSGRSCSRPSRSGTS